MSFLDIVWGTTLPNSGWECDLEDICSWQEADFIFIQYFFSKYVVEFLYIPNECDFKNFHVEPHNPSTIEGQSGILNVHHQMT